MTAFEHIQRARQANLVNVDGESVVVKPGPPYPPDKIAALEKEIGLPLPRELTTLLTQCAEVEGLDVDLHFGGEGMSFGMEEVFPHGLTLAADGFGNFWVLDITPETTETAPVFFACHDAPVILYQCADLATFVAEVIRMDTPPHKSLVDDVHEDRPFNVWRSNPGLIDLDTAAASDDPAIREFAASLPDYFQIVDLRNVEPGMGFSWGRHGPRTEIRRHGYERIFGYGRPPRKGLFAKLFGR